MDDTPRSDMASLFGNDAFCSFMVGDHIVVTVGGIRKLGNVAEKGTTVRRSVSSSQLSVCRSVMQTPKTRVKN